MGVESEMDPYTDAIRQLPPIDKLKLVEQIWDDLSEERLPLPDWALEEVARRRDEMVKDPNLGLTHDEVWRRINDARTQ